MFFPGHSPTYLLEHLATFTVSPENDLVYPADGMRRLLAMEKTNGIWTQKMMMRIERKVVNVMDHENKEIVEQFPLGEIEMCRVIQNHTQKCTSSQSHDFGIFARAQTDCNLLL